MGAYLRRDESAVRQDLDFALLSFPPQRAEDPDRGHPERGESQMLAIAGPLISPKILMLDEPSLGIAPVMRTHFRTSWRSIERGR